MKLSVLFVITEESPSPRPVAIVDPLTVKESTHTEDEYKKLVEEAVRDSETVIKLSGWYELALPMDAANTIGRELRNQPSVFPAQVTADPVKEVHPSINSITVTVGRKPGKIVDDEIRG